MVRKPSFTLAGRFRTPAEEAVATAPLACDARFKGLGTTEFTASVNAFMTEAAGTAESVTLTIKPAVPAAVGVPLITPEPLRDSPAGRAPDSSVQ